MIVVMNLPDKYANFMSVTVGGVDKDQWVFNARAFDLNNGNYIYYENNGWNQIFADTNLVLPENTNDDLNESTEEANTNEETTEDTHEVTE